MEDPNRNRNLVVGAAVAVSILFLGAAVFLTGQGKGAFDQHVMVFTDFATITGLRRDSSVQLAGVEIGSVRSIDFYETSYACDPIHEDRGRQGEGRSDDCDPQFFCSPEGECGDLERFASEQQHEPCINDADCPMDAVCVTKQFRRRYNRVFWAGDDNVCARFSTVHQRVRVAMAIKPDKLHLIGKDSRARVASNSVLGDQLVEITRGAGQTVEPGDTIQSVPSVYEDMEAFRQRVEGIFVKVDEGLGKISTVFGELNDERVIAKMRDTIASLNEETADLAHGRGSIGTYFGDEPRKTWENGMATTRQTAREVDGFLREGNQTLQRVESNIQPRIDDARQTMADMRAKMSDIRDPSAKDSPARLIYDPSGQKLAEVEAEIDETRAAMSDMDAGKGTLGELVNSDALFETLVETFGFDARPDTLRDVVREALERYEAKHE